MGITDLPPEILEEILLHCDPIVVAAIAQSCRAFASLIYHPADDHLWRTLYLLQPLDDPRNTISQVGWPRPGVQGFAWKRELQAIIRARTVANNPTLCRADERCTILRTLLDLVCYVPPLSGPHVDGDMSRNLAWVEGLLRDGSMLDKEKIVWVPSEEEAQLRARLHTHFGLTEADKGPAARSESRAFVYSMRNYGWGNDFGPFHSNGHVNWVHMQAIHHVMSTCLLDLMNILPIDSMLPMSLRTSQIVSPPATDDLDAEKDWAGVKGAWQVSFCFCDHRELLHYNTTAESPEDPLDPSIFDSPSFVEVFRSLDLTIHITKIIPDPRHPNQPKIHFVGVMSDPSTSTMNGWVSMTDDDQVRWHFVSGEQGNAVWSSEGVQVGGVRSSFGVLGSWTTVFHDHDDPIGPFWLRKVNTMSLH